MNPLRIARVGFSVLGLALAFGCGDETGQFVIVQNQIPDQTCTVPGAKGDAYRGEGRLDVALVGDDAQVGYRLFPLLQNNLRHLGRSREPNRLVLDSFSVRVEVAGDAPKTVIDAFNKSDERLRRYEEPWSGTLDPGGSTVSAGVTVVAGELARRIRATRALETQGSMRLFVNVRALARKLDGGFVASDEFRFPITVCQGCLVSNVQACPVLPRNLGNACNIAQDVPVDCCLSDNRLVCPAVGPSAAAVAPAPPVAPVGK